MRQSGRRRRDVLIGLATIGAILAILWDPVIDPFIHRERNRSEVMALFDALAPGMARERVAGEVTSERYPHLTVRRVEPNLWSVETPMEFGAGNWILWIEFEGERVRALRIRTADGLHVHPADAPPDRTLPGVS